MLVALNILRILFWYAFVSTFKLGTEMEMLVKWSFRFLLPLLKEVFFLPVRGTLCSGTSRTVPWYCCGDSDRFQPLLCNPDPGWYW